MASSQQDWVSMFNLVANSDVKVKTYDSSQKQLIELTEAE